MGFYLIKRLLLMIPLFIGITIISFGVIHLAPGSPIDMATDLNPKATAEVKERMRAFYGLDQPLHIQYWNWIRRLVALDFGISFSQDGRKVADKILERMPITIFINVVSLVIIFFLAVPIGVLSATHQNTLFDKITTVVVFMGFAVPHFWLALLLMILFGVQLGWLPISGLKSLNYEYLPVSAQIWDRVSHLILPIIYHRLRRARRPFPLHAFQHAGSDPPGLHHHRQVQRPVHPDGHFQTRLAQRPHAGHHHSGLIRSRADRGQRHF